METFNQITSSTYTSQMVHMGQGIETDTRVDTFKTTDLKVKPISDVEVNVLPAMLVFPRFSHALYVSIPGGDRGLQLVGVSQERLSTPGHFGFSVAAPKQQGDVCTIGS